MSSDPDDRREALLSDEEPEAPNVRARRAAAGVAAAFGLAVIWLIGLGLVAGCVGYVVLWVVLPFMHSGAW